jgi:hypothetical protein
MPSEAEIEELAIPDYPMLFKHMVLAIFLSGNLPRSRPPVSKNRIPVKSSPNKDNFDPTKFNAAMDVAMSQLKKYRMISEKSGRGQISLTGYGREKDSEHKREPDARRKAKRFDDYYQKLIIEERRRVPKAKIAEEGFSDTAPASTQNRRGPEGSNRQSSQPSNRAPTSGGGESASGSNQTSSQPSNLSPASRIFG